MKNSNRNRKFKLFQHSTSSKASSYAVRLPELHSADLFPVAEHIWKWTEDNSLSHIPASRKFSAVKYPRGKKHELIPIQAQRCNVCLHNEEQEIILN